MPTFSDPSGLICGVLYLALLLLVGYALLSAILRAEPRHWLSLLGFSFALGIGALSTLYFWWSLLGHTPGRSFSIAVAAAAVAVIFFCWRRGQLPVASIPSPMGKFEPQTLLAIAGLALIVICVSNVISETGWPGLTDVDSYAIWMFKAKIVTLQAVRPIPIVLKLPTLSFSHQDYPLSLPFLVAGFFGILGHLNDEQAKILLLPIYLALGAVIYSAIRQTSKRSVAIALTAIFTAAPTLTMNAGFLVAETPLLLMWSAATASLVRWIEIRRCSDLLLAGLFTAFAAFTKNEGLALLPVIGMVSLSAAIASQKQRVIKDWLLAASLAIASIIPWLIYRTHLPRTHEDYGTKLTHPAVILSNLARLAYVLPQFFGRMFDFPRIGFIWTLLILVALLGFRGFIRPVVISLWILLITQLLLYTGTFVVTPWDIRQLLPLIASKLLTQASPLAILLIAQHLRCVRANPSHPVSAQSA